MLVTVQNLRTYAKASKLSFSFTADIHVDGKRAFTIHDDGMGRKLQFWNVTSWVTVEKVADYAEDVVRWGNGDEPRFLKRDMFLYRLVRETVLDPYTLFGVERPELEPVPSSSVVTAPLKLETVEVAFAI